MQNMKLLNKELFAKSNFLGLRCVFIKTRETYIYFNYYHKI